MITAFKSRFGGSPILYRAPARVNIIGEHTDYNDGYVLPTTTALYTSLLISKRSDRVMRVYSARFDNEVLIDLDDIKRGTDDQWCEYVKGVAHILQSEGHSLCGADMHVDTEIPLGSGLSSSASLETVVGLALLDCAGIDIDRSALADICHRAELEFVGVRCGVMDQYTISCNAAGHALLLDCRSLHAESVPLFKGMELLVIDSGVSHQLQSGDYNSRRDECEEAVTILKTRHPELTSLRDLSFPDLEDSKDLLDDKLYRRCRHVVKEIDRVQVAASALRGEDVEQLGETLNASHASLRGDYEVSCNELDTLVEIATNCEGVYGARMMGAGFGGCTVNLVATPHLGQTIQKIRAEYGRQSGQQPWTHVVRPAQAVHRVESGKPAEQALGSGGP